MERPRLVPQLYGYAVCLVCVVTILISANGLINGVFDTVSPEMSREMMYAEFRPRPAAPPPDAAGVVTAAVEQVPDSVLRARFEEERTQRVAVIRYNGLRSVVGATLLLLIAGGLFLGHWRWLRRLGQSET